MELSTGRLQLSFKAFQAYLQDSNTILVTAAPAAGDSLEKKNCKLGVVHVEAQEKMQQVRRKGVAPWKDSEVLRA